MSGREGRQDPVDHGAGAGRPDDPERGRGEGGHPAARDDVVEVGDVVAVEVGEHQRGQLVGLGAGRGRAHQDTPAAVEQQRRAAGAHEGGRAGAQGVDERAAGAEQGDLDHAECSVIPTVRMQPLVGCVGAAPARPPRAGGHRTTAPGPLPRAPRARTGRRDRRGLHRMVQARAAHRRPGRSCSRGTTRRWRRCAERCWRSRPSTASMSPPSPGSARCGRTPPCRRTPSSCWSDCPACRSASSSSSSRSPRSLTSSASWGGWPAAGTASTPPWCPRCPVAPPSTTHTTLAAELELDAAEAAHGSAGDGASTTARARARPRRPPRGPAARRRRAAARPHGDPRLADGARGPPLRGVRPRRVGHGHVARAPCGVPRAQASGMGRLRPRARAPGRPRPGLRVAPRLQPRPPAPRHEHLPGGARPPGVVGTLDEARAQVRGSLRVLADR